MIAHAPIYPDHLAPPWESILASDWAAQQTSGFCFYGHIHDDMGVFQSGDVTFCNHGALTRGSLGESDRTRTPSVTHFDDKTFTRIPLKSALPADQILRIAERAQAQEARAAADDFMALCKTQITDENTTSSLTSEIAAMEQIPAPVRKRAVDLLTHAAEAT